MSLDRVISENLFETPFAGIVITDEKGEVIRCNSRFNVLTGYRLEDVQGVPVDTYFHPESLVDFCISCDRMKGKEHKRSGVLVKFLKNEGGYTDIIVTIYDMRDGDRLTGYIVYMEPFTGEKISGSYTDEKGHVVWLTEGEKDPKEEFLCNIFHGIQESILIIDSKESVVSFNMKVLELLGVDMQYLMEEVSFKEISPDDMNYKVAKKLISECFKGNDQAFTWQLKKPGSGEVIDVEVYMTLIDKMGEQVVMATIRDITDKKLMEDILRSSESRYRQLVEHSPDGIVIHKNGVIKYLNPAAANILGGETAEDVLGRKVLEFFPEDQWDVIKERMRKLYEEKVSLPLMEGKILRLDGSVALVDFAAMPFEMDGVTAVQVVMRDMTEKRRQEEYIRYLALHDKLTGLPNRELLAERVSKAAKRRKRDKLKNAVIYFDLDGFKPINDTMGHDAGDEALREIASRVESAVRESDTASRMGGDEFVVLLEGVKDFGEIRMVAKRVHDSVNELLEIDGVQFHVGASMGIAVYPDDSTDHSELISMADKAMYHVKQSGKNRFEFYSVLPKK